MDDLDRYVAEQVDADPAFLTAYQAALERRRLTWALAQVRTEKGFTQASLAKASASTQAVISRLEAGGDFKFSTLQRVIHALGFADVQTAMLELARRAAASDRATCRSGQADVSARSRASSIPSRVSQARK